MPAEPRPNNYRTSFMIEGVCRGCGTPGLVFRSGGRCSSCCCKTSRGGRPVPKSFHVEDDPEAARLRRQKEGMHAAFAIMRERLRGRTAEQAFAKVSQKPRFRDIDWGRVYSAAFGVPCVKAAPDVKAEPEPERYGYEEMW